MDLKTTSNQVLALSGAYQACASVKQIACKGMCDAKTLSTGLNSTLKIDTDNVEDVYGGLGQLRHGLNMLSKHLKSAPDDDLDISRYVYGLIAIERKLAKRQDLLELIYRDLQLANNKLEYYDIHHANTWSTLADIYQNSISGLSPRIMVKGESVHLDKEENAAKIRALLLAGIRSVVLWRQCGGNRIVLTLNKRSYARDIQSLLASMNE